VTREIENIWEINAPCLEPGARVTFASFSTDGVDGRSGLAGAIADNDTLRLARRKGLNHKKYLADFDSAGFFERLDLGIVTGPTGTNVADIVLVLMSLSNRKLAFVFGGEATVKMELPEGRTPGSGGRNTHLALLACEKLDRI
jgi:glycerate-2-kinase